MSGGDCDYVASPLNFSSSNNLIEGPDACSLTDGVNGNIIGQDPKLDALADNGGATQTMALGAGSPAIDTGKNTGCPATDQRGVARPVGTGCDIGAYEHVSSDSTVALTITVFDGILRGLEQGNWDLLAGVAAGVVGAFIGTAIANHFGAHG